MSGAPFLAALASIFRVEARICRRKAPLSVTDCRFTGLAFSRSEAVRTPPLLDDLPARVGIELSHRTAECGGVRS